MTESDRATEALIHLRSAVIELVEAARAALDVVEEVVSDPERMAPVISTLADLGRLVGPALWAWRAPGGAPDAGSPPDDAGGDDPGPPGSRVQRIRIS